MADLRPVAGRRKDATEVPVEVGLTLIGDAPGDALRGADLIQSLLAFAHRQPRHPRRAEPNPLITGMARRLPRLPGEDVEVVLTLADDL
jgi:hypothetical protein